MANVDYLFDIDLHQSDLISFHKITQNDSIFAEYLTCSRGVELSKKGKVYRCPNCLFWLPYPSTKFKKCPHCDNVLDLQTSKPEIIVSTTPVDGFIPFVVGENVQRYELRNPYWIDAERKGIKYKDVDLYSGPKILVRKTGIGISATIDYWNYFTNQVVYILKPKNGLAETLPLELFLIILNSRAIAYLMMKRHGELEWRSHPYITQSQLLSIPFPSILREKRISSEIYEIIDLMSSRIRKGLSVGTELDMKIERIVAGFYNLSIRDYEQFITFFSKAQQLIGIRRLGNMRAEEIFASQ